MSTALHNNHLFKLFAFFLLLIMEGGSAQTMIAGWDFQTTTTGGTAAATAPNSPAVFAANFGSGTIYFNGTNGSSSWITASSGNELTAFGGTALNTEGGLSTATSGASALAILGGTSQSANGKYAIFKFSMAGFTDLVVSYASRNTNSGFSTQNWEYSADGVNWTAAGTVTGLSTSFAVFTLDTITALNNATTAYLRFSGTGATAATGNNRLDNIQFRATPGPVGPEVTTGVASAITVSGATLNGSVNANDNPTDITFEYGTTSAYGTSVSASPAVLSTSVETAVSADISGLAVNTQYHFRTVGTVSGAPTNGSDMTFYTLANVPGTPTVSNPQIASLDVSLAGAENGNPAATEYAIRLSDGTYVQASGETGVSADWQTASAWGTITVTGLSSSTTYTFDVQARNGDDVETGFGSSAAGTTLENFDANVSITTEVSSFGDVCTNSSSIGSFVFDGANLDGSAISLSGTSAYTFSLSESGPFLNPLLINYSNGTIDAQQVFVQFSPTAGQSFDTDLTLTGGGLPAAVNVAVTGTGITTNVVASTGTASSISSTGATLSGTLTEGCFPVSEYGVEYSTVANFTPGTGTTVSGSNLAGGNFTVAAAGLQPNTVYYYSAFASDNTTDYGNQATFTTSDISTPVVTAATLVGVNSFTANWDAVAGATGYRLDVSTSPEYGVTQNLSDLIISEYIEGSSNNKALELYNGTGAAVDLSAYTLKKQVNGAGTFGSDLSLTGTLADGAVYVIAYNQANTSIKDLADLVTSSGSLSFNGNDAVALYKNDVQIDVVGIVNQSANWAADKTLVRKASVLAPTVNYDAGDWNVLPIDTISNLGFHTVNNTTPSFVAGYENLLVNGTSQLVSGLTDNTTYYYRVRAVSDNSTSANSDNMSVTTTAAAPTFGAISQVAMVVCEDSAATFNVTGLLPNSTSTISYEINGGATQTISNVVANASGFATIEVVLALENNGQVLTVTSIERTDAAGGSISPSTNNTAVLSVNANEIYYADADGDGFGNAAVTTLSCDGVPAGYSANATDCNDSDASVYQTGTLYVDADNDGYTNGETATVCYGSTAPSGYALTNIGIDCEDSVAAINPGHSEVLYNGVDDNCDGNLDEGFQITSNVQPGQCGTTLTSIGSLISAISLPQVNGYRWEVTNTATNEIQMLETGLQFFSLTQLASYDYATTYSVRVMVRRNGVWLGYYGSSCLVSSPAILAPGGAAQISPSQCGITLPSISTLVSTTSLAGVTGYRFRITNLTDASAPNQVQILDRPLQWFNLPMLSTYNYGTSYLIEVAVKTNGAYSGFGSPCIINSPDVPSLTNCGATVSMPSTLISTVSLNKVTSYRFELTNTVTNQIITIDRALQFFSFNNVPGYSPATAYGVRVAVMTNGVYSPFGDACEITSPGAARPESPKAEIPAAVAFKAVAYPNPFVQSFGLNVNSAAESAVNVRIYDITGRLIDSHNATISTIETLAIGEKYPSGVYNVIVSQGNDVKTLRVIKR